MQPADPLYFYFAVADADAAAPPKHFQNHLLQLFPRQLSLSLSFVVRSLSPAGLRNAISQSLKEVRRTANEREAVAVAATNVTSQGCKRRKGGRKKDVFLSPVA